MNEEGTITHTHANGNSTDTHPDGSVDHYDASGNPMGSSPPGTVSYEATKEAALAVDKRALNF